MRCLRLVISNMKASILRLGLLLALAGGSVSAAEPQVRVAASKELRLAVVDTNKSSEARDAMHQAFAASLGRMLTQQCGAPVGVRAKRVGADHAAFNLNAGVYDAVLVVARDMPASLRRSNAMVLSAAPDGSKLHLLIAEGDPGLQGLLAGGFARALNDQIFLAQLAVAEGRPAASAGEKIAASQ